MDEYTKKIIYYMNNQEFLGKLDNNTHVLSLKSSDCGDWNDIYLKVVDEIIVEISYENSGCALNVASLEIICEYLKGKNLNEINQIESSIIKDKLSYPKDKEHCLSLVFETLNQVSK